MPALTKGKLEQFAQSIANGLTPAAAYVRAGYSIKGAASSAARLLQNAPICARIAELRQAIAEVVERIAIDLKHHDGVWGVELSLRGCEQRFLLHVTREGWRLAGVS